MRCRALAAPLLGGAVGFLTYEAAAATSASPSPRSDPLDLPRQWFAIFDTVAVFDHAQRRLLLSSCVHRDDPAGFEAAYARALERIDGAAHRHLRGSSGAAVRPLARTPVDAVATTTRPICPGTSSRTACCARSTTSSPGDIFQVQVSRRFALAAAGASLRRLRRTPGHQPEPLHDLHRHPGVHAGRRVAGDARAGHRPGRARITRSREPDGAGARPRTTSDGARAPRERQGGGRAPHAHRPRTQRSRPRLRDRQRARHAAHGGGALLARDAPREQHRGNPRRQAAVRSTRSVRAFLPGP